MSVTVNRVSTPQDGYFIEQKRYTRTQKLTTKTTHENPIAVGSESKYTRGRMMQSVQRTLALSASKRRGRGTRRAYFEIERFNLFCRVCSCVSCSTTVSTGGTDPLGIPAAFSYFLLRQKSRINPATDKELKDLRGANHVVVGD